MQKHQQWLQNRNYQHHLECLIRIKQNLRKSEIKSALQTARNRTLQHRPTIEEEPHNSCDSRNEGSPRHAKGFRIGEKQKELLWNNFLLGKRIIEASPVISVKKQKQQYRKHKKMVDWRVQQTKRFAVNTEFRQERLKQFNQNTHRLTNCFRLTNSGPSRNVLALKITKFQLPKTKPHIEDMLVKMRLEGRRSAQSSQIINFQSLHIFEFFFKYISNSRRKNHSRSSSRQAICIDIYEAKGLEERHLGGFTIERENIGAEKSYLQSEFIKSGKAIGTVEFQVQICKKQVLQENL